jgi:hypothetical protein
MKDLCTCKICEKQFDYLRKQKGTKSICPSCMANRHRWQLKTIMVVYKGGGCQLCGYKKCMRSLDFHHVDPSKKLRSLGANHNRSWQSIRDELDKCICVCRNCHGEVEEALELVSWGHPQRKILDRVNSIHKEFVSVPMNYSRHDWIAYHPKFMDTNKNITKMEVYNMGMARKITKGEYQIGIYHIQKIGRKWVSKATGPGTIGDGSPREHTSFRAAYEAITGEPLNVTTGHR